MPSEFKQTILSIKGVDKEAIPLGEKAKKKKKRDGKLEQLNEVSNSFRERSSYNTTPNRSAVIL